MRIVDAHDAAHRTAVRRMRTATTSAALVATIVVAGCASRPLAPPAPDTAPTPIPPTAPASVTRAPSVDELLRVPDAVPRHEPRARRGNPPFYEVYGVRYTVLPESRGYVERGVASWYGPDFHGVATSTGEAYDMYSMTAAHRTLPLPAYARVTNLRNGRSVVVRINDRGPFKANRIIDLSYSAALRLDMVRDGTTLVEVRTLEPEGTPPPPPAPAAIHAQVGAFAAEANATRLLERLRALGVADAFVRRDEVAGRTVYRVRVGPIASVADYDSLVARLRDLGHADVRLAAD
jgi:rare lipoprotein A